MPSGSNEEEKPKFFKPEDKHLKQIEKAVDLERQVELNQLEKDKFLSSKESMNFQLFLVISQIRMDQINEDPFIKHHHNVVKAINKAIRELLLKINRQNNKQTLKEQQDQICRVFFDDVTVGFITSTGQIKSTAYVYVNKPFVTILDRQRINLEYHKLEIKITLTYFQIAGLKIIPPLCQNMIMDPFQAFIRNNKFYNEFLVLSQTDPEELREGISIFFVYKPSDDQIYAVKRSRLIAKRLTFTDVFHPTGDLTVDQRKIREAKILSKLSHPNILKFYEWWVEQAGGVYYLYVQLEYCSFPGYKHQPTDLLTYSYYYLNPLCNKEKLKALKNIMVQIVDGIEYIHKRGIIHRDLKPENLFVTVNTLGELQVMLADFDQGKDVREFKLSSSNILLDEDLRSIKSQNTIRAGTVGYQTQNYEKNKSFDKVDEFYAIGITLLHLILTFPGEPKNRNHYAKTFIMSKTEDIIPLLDSWAVKFVKNRGTDFTFQAFEIPMRLARQLVSKEINDYEELKQAVLQFM